MHAACKSLKIKQQRFHHLDYDHLKYLLHQTKSLSNPRFILSESVFGMDGDIADLEILIKLAKDYHAILYIDEAHATGLFGKQGFGLTENYKNEIDISMGTFSKALGGSGAYIACSSIIKRFLINKCQGFVFSTAPSPMQVAAMQMAWDLLPSLQTQAQLLLQKANTLRKTLRKMNLDTGTSTTHIIPIILKEPAKTLAAQRYLASKEIRVSAIRSPSVPPNQSRLRIALNINHDDEAINCLVRALGELSQR
jgi:8-amino-7-oxononanoate synthase